VAGVNSLVELDFAIRTGRPSGAARSDHLIDLSLPLKQRDFGIYRSVDVMAIRSARPKTLFEDLLMAAGVPAVHRSGARRPAIREQTVQVRRTQPGHRRQAVPRSCGQRAAPDGPAKKRHDRPEKANRPGHQTATRTTGVVIGVWTNILKIMKPITAIGDVHVPEK
jgi:hypothetical protein